MTGIRQHLPWLTILLLAAPAAAQQPAPVGSAELLDRVVAVVGDSVIVQSDLEEELVQLIGSGQLPATDSAMVAEARRQILDAQVTELLLIQAALRDSLVVTPEETEAAVRRQITDLQRNFGGEAAFERALREQLGMSLLEYREMLARQYQREALREQYLQSVMRERRPPPVTESEIREFFDLYRDQLGERPATVAFRQVMVAPQPSDSARADARTRIEEILRAARDGEDFAVLARRFSEDAGSRDQGGDLGWARADQWVTPFARAVFSMRPGTISDVVETSYGFHIIKLERVRGAERQARHILIRPELTDADYARTRSRADEVVERLRAGESIDRLIEAYGQPDADDHVDARQDRLPEPYAVALADARPGDVVGPIRLGDGDNVSYAVVRVTSVTPAGEFRIDDVRAQIRQQLEQEKLLDEILADLRRKTYVDIRL